MRTYNPSKIEKKWQKYWESKKFYQAKDNIPDKANQYILAEFPYPSGNLHTGHWYAYSVPDIYVRWLRMRWFYNVMFPIGFDAFGLPAENAAIKNNLQPKDWTENNIRNMTKQLKSIGASFDWSREVNTSKPDYYKWTQWIFIQLYNKGLAYRAQVPANWCPKDKTVLANEQVVNGRCERCGTRVIQKNIEQWLFRITHYADELVDGLKGLDWPDAAKLAQENWIGRNKGAEIKFLISGHDGNHENESHIMVFTTRPDTVYGATYLVLAPEHPFVNKFASEIKNFQEVQKYIETSKNKTELDRLSVKEKTGVILNGVRVLNPATCEETPVYVADYVLPGYGSGAIMGVPAHDERDFEFAKLFNLPIRNVIVSAGEGANGRAYMGEGTLQNSGQFNGYQSKRAAREIVMHLKKQGLAAEKTNYKLRDWLISRQRYWGAPIPMIKCQDCGYQPVPEDKLPVVLPKLENFKPDKNGRSPLARAENWVKTACPKCGNEAARETDTMDTFVDSSWYFFRYADPKNKKEFASKDKVDAWLPVDVYIGGSEHNTMHLLYSRFVTKALFDMKHVPCKNPFSKRVNHGVILGEDRQKMSKSRGNVVDPDKIVAQYGADAVRMFFAFMGPYDQGGPFTTTGINGVSRFLKRVWVIANQHFGSTDSQIERVIHRTVKKVGEDIEKFHFNTAVSELMKLLNAINGKQFSKDQFKVFLRILAPFAPHLSEEIWQEVLGGKKSIHLEKWPEYDPMLIDEEKMQFIVQVNGKTRAILSANKDTMENEIKSEALSLPSIKKYLAGREVKKTVFSKNRFINFVI